MIMIIIYAIIVATDCAFRSTQKGLSGKISHFIAHLTRFSEVKCVIALAAKEKMHYYCQKCSKILNIDKSEHNHLFVKDHG